LPGPADDREMDAERAASEGWGEKLHHEAADSLEEVSKALLEQGTEPSHDQSGAQAHFFADDERDKAAKDAKRAAAEYDQDHPVTPE